MNYFIGKSIKHQELREKIFKITNGNPFFIEEYVRYLFEKRHLKKVKDTIEADSLAKEIHSPLTVHDIMLIGHAC